MFKGMIIVNTLQENANSITLTCLPCVRLFMSYGKCVIGEHQHHQNMVLRRQTRSHGVHGTHKRRIPRMQSPRQAKGESQWQNHSERARKAKSMARLSVR